jgi:hypothetical protein
LFSFFSSAKHIVEFLENMNSILGKEKVLFMEETKRCVRSIIIILIIREVREMSLEEINHFFCFVNKNVFNI